MLTKLKDVLREPYFLREINHRIDQGVTNVVYYISPITPFSLMVE